MVICACAAYKITLIYFALENQNKTESREQQGGQSESVYRHYDYVLAESGSLWKEIFPFICCVTVVKEVQRFFYCIGSVCNT